VFVVGDSNMEWAISSNGLGNPVSARAIERDWELQPNEIFTVAEGDYQTGMVLNSTEDGLEKQQ